MDWCYVGIDSLEVENHAVFPRALGDEKYGGQAEPWMVCGPLYSPSGAQRGDFRRYAPTQPGGHAGRGETNDAFGKRTG